MIKGWGHSCWVPEGPFWRLMFLKTRDGALNNPSCCVSPLNMHAWGVRQMNVHYLLLRGQNIAIQRFQWRSSVWASHDKNTRLSSWLWNSRQTRYSHRKCMTSPVLCQHFGLPLGRLSPLFSQTSHSPAWRVKQAFLSMMLCLRLLSFYSTVSFFVLNNEMSGWSWP